MSVEAHGAVGQKRGEPEGLPVRWVLILALAAAASVSVGLASGLAYGVGAAIAVVGLCHRIVR